MIKLKPCPFCGNKFVELSDARALEDCMNFEECSECFESSQSSCNLYIVVCSVNEGGYGASSGYHTSAEKAIKAWNRRNVKNINSINRQAIIDAIVNTPTDVYSHDKIISVLDGAAFRQNEIIDIINALPSTEPERKKGKWISIFDEEESKCSECEKEYYYPKERKYYFCPNCGADMRGEQE